MPTFVARLLAAALSALALGVATGLVARLLMRVINLAFHQPTGFTWAGTVAILLIFVLGMGPAAAGAALGRGPRTASGVVRWTGVVISAGFLGSAAAITAVADGANLLQVLPAGRLVLAIAALAGFAAAIVAGAVLTARLTGRLADRFESAPGPLRRSPTLVG